jgi:hypothetical protein
VDQPRFHEDYYLIFMKDKFRPHSKKLVTETENLLQIDVQNSNT